MGSAALLPTVVQLPYKSELVRTRRLDMLRRDVNVNPLFAVPETDNHAAFRTHDTPSQSLEVITDALQTPTLAIISPTPRAFTFPIDQSKTCPYSSPVNSPFEPDLRKLTLTPSHPTLVRTLTPLSGPASPSSHKRRKSSVCSDIERRPRKGDEDYIKRPENAFILFRRKCCEERQQAQEEAVSAAYADAPTKKQRQADLSKTISQQWKALSAEERLYWEEQAKEKKKEHEQMYPNYVYRPSDRRIRRGRRVSEASLSTRRMHGRSASAPTPPPARQTIQVPTVYMPSCPTSPSLLPMISRRASHPDHGMNSSASQFDFLPQQQFSHPNAYVSGLDVNGFYHGMFENPSAPHPLSISTDMSMLHASQQMISPVSSIASASSGPHTGPYTPVDCMASAFSYHEAPRDLASCMNEAEIDSPMSGSPLENMQFGYPESYSWEGQGAWGSHGDLLAGDEFDLSAIPPIQLGMPGCGGELVSMSQHPSAFNIDYAPSSFDASSLEVHQYPLEMQAHDTFEQLFNFDNMLVAPAGF
ncbi:hypothetical protein BDR07DRAFT_1482864 [Suillus spraguei]|nr:hypothetical protein BDR07DRAFT_1482864 [Suillus spraguei]